MVDAVAWFRRTLLSRSRSSSADVYVFTAFAALLVGLLVVVVPLATLVSNASPKLLLVGVAVLYGLGITALDRVFEGACVALLVVVVFNVSGFLVESAVPGIGVRLVDVLLVVVLLSSVFSDREGERAWVDGRVETLAIGAFAAFVLWSCLAAVVENGPSRWDAFDYTFAQLRYLLLLCTSMLITDRTDPRGVVSALGIAICGVLVFAADEVFAGEAGYLVNFGPLGDAIEGLWPSPSLTSLVADSAIVYGEIGQSRIAVGLAIVVVPLVLAAATRYRRYAPVAAVGLLGVVSVVASGSHAGILGLYVGLACVAGYWVYLAVDRVGTERARRAVVPSLVGVGALLLVGAVAAAAAGEEQVLFVRTDNLEVRLRQYEAAIDLAGRFPLFGVGGGWNHFIVLGTEVHNLFLANLAATGIPGFLALVTSVAATTWVGLTRLAESPADERWLWVGVLGGMAAFYAYSFWVVAHRWEPLNAVYWVLAGVVIGASAPVEASSDGLGARLRNGVRSRIRGREDRSR